MPTLFLKGVIVLMGLIVFALCIFALPSAWQNGPLELPAAHYAIKLIVIGLYATAIPFYIALWHSFKLLKYVEANMAFSEQSAKTLSIVRRSAVGIAVLYIGGYPLLYPIAQADDAPGIIIFGLIIVCAPVTVALFTFVLERLLRSKL